MNRIFIFTGFDGTSPLDDERHLQHWHTTFRIRTIHGNYAGPFNVTQTSCYYCLATTSVPPRSSTLLRKPHQPICFLNVPNCGLAVHYTSTLGSYSMSTKVEVSICPMGAAMRLQRSVIGVKLLRCISSPTMLYLAPWATVTLPSTLVISLCRPNIYQYGRYRFHDRESVISKTGDVC